MERNPLSVTPPSWLNIDPDSYKRLLNRTAVTITKRARKRGATYQVRERPSMPSMQPSFVVTARIPTTDCRWTIAFMMEAEVRPSPR